MFRSRVLLVAAVLTASASFAQYTNSYGYSFNNPISASVNQMTWDRLNQRLVLRVMLKKHGFTDAQLNGMSTDQMLASLGGAKQAAQESKALPATPASKFKPAGKRLLVPTLATSLSTDPEQQKVLRQVFEAGLKEYEKEAAREGLVNDLAGAMAFFLGTAWYVLHDGQDPDEDGLTLVARQLQQLFDTPEMRKIADAEKQQFYELLVGMATWLGVTWQAAAQSDDQALKAQLKDAANGIIKGYFKLEPSRVRITAAGLELTK
jgi:hypothetical protein